MTLPNISGLLRRWPHTLRLALKKPTEMLLSSQRPSAISHARKAWHKWHAIFKLAHIVVAYRPGFPIDTWQARMPEPLAHEYAARYMHQQLAVHLATAGGITAVSMTGLDISATFVRTALRAGTSARYLLPDSVLDYIHTHGLYR